MFSENRFLYINGGEKPSYEPEDAPEVEGADMFQELEAVEKDEYATIGAAFDAYINLDAETMDNVRNHLARLNTDQEQYIDSHWNQSDEFGKVLNINDKVEAVMEFQYNYNQRFGENIAIDGDVGPQTLAALDRAMATDSASEQEEELFSSPLDVLRNEEGELETGISDLDLNTSIEGQVRYSPTSPINPDVDLSTAVDDAEVDIATVDTSPQTVEMADVEPSETVPEEAYAQYYNPETGELDLPLGGNIEGR